MHHYPELLASLSHLTATAQIAQAKYAQSDEEAFNEALITLGLLLAHARQIVGLKVTESPEPAQTPTGEFISIWRVVAERIHRDNVEKGFWGDGTTERNVGEAIALMHSELSEALEAYRHGNPKSEKIPGFRHAEEEFADLIIRVMDFTAAHAMDIPEAIVAKIEYNRSRPPKHGKEF